MNRVVITGMGIWSCLGKTLDEVRDSLYEGRSGIVFDPERKEIGFRSALTGKVEVPDLKKRTEPLATCVYAATGQIRLLRHEGRSSRRRSG